MWNKRIDLSIEKELLCVPWGTNVAGSATRLPSAHFLVIRLANTITSPPLAYSLLSIIFTQQYFQLFPFRFHACVRFVWHEVPQDRLSLLARLQSRFCNRLNAPQAKMSEQFKTGGFSSQEDG